MGLKPLLYLDTCIVIYLVEEHPIYQPVIETALSNGLGVVCHSRVGWANGSIVCPRGILRKSVGRQKDTCPPYATHTF